MTTKNTPNPVQIARRRNLLRLIGDKHGDVHAFAEKHDLSEQYLYQVKNERREVGERAARKIELHANLPSGWLDTTPSEQGAVDPFVSCVAEAIESREVPSHMKATILFMLGTAQPK